MTQRDRDRLVVLKKAQKKLVTQKQAAAELRVTERHVRRLLQRLATGGDKAVIHALRGRGFEPQAKRGGAAESDCGSFAARVEGFWPDAGQLPSCEGSRHPDRARGFAAADGDRRTVAAEAAEDQRHSPVAAAAQLSRRTGSVGHQRTRLAGGRGRETVSDLDDRRCHEPLAGALCS